MRAHTANEYERRIEIILRYIVEHLDEALLPDELAARAAFSRFHFQRIFRAMTGESVADLVRRLKLERAAAKLRQEQTNVIDIALEAGYQSGEAFARAFKRAVGVAPTAYRVAWPPPALRPRTSRVLFRVADGFVQLESANGGPIMDVNIESHPAMHYAFARHVGPYPDIGPSFERLFAWAENHGLLGPATQCFSLSYDDPDAVDAASLRSDACLSLEDGSIEGSEGIQIGTLPAGRYAVHRHVGPYDGAAAAYRRMFGQWLPASGESTAERPCVEIYLGDPATTPPAELETLLCIPLNGDSGK